MSARLGIIGGYLGSGKTTVVNRLLTAATLGRTAVVVNDFGSVNIDADLIASATDDTIELTNGCICCQVGDDVARTMSALAAREDLHHVLCEVSGVGDPGQLASWRDYPGFSPAPVLVCADATDIRRLLRDEYVGDTVARQLTAAEVVLVTKTDLASPAEVDDAARTCREAAPGARIVVQPSQGPEVTAAEAVLDALGAGTPAGGRKVDGHTGGTDDPSSPGHHASNHVSVTLEVAGPVDVEALARAVNELPGGLVRAKGVVQGLDGAWHEVHLAGRRAHVRTLDGMGPRSERPAVVLIAVGPGATASLDAARSALAPLLASRG